MHDIQMPVKNNSSEASEVKETVGIDSAGVALEGTEGISSLASKNSSSSLDTLDVLIVEALDVGDRLILGVVVVELLLFLR